MCGRNQLGRAAKKNPSTGVQCCSVLTTTSTSRVGTNVGYLGSDVFTDYKVHAVDWAVASCVTHRAEWLSRHSVYSLFAKS